MTLEEKKDYADKYKRTALKLGVVITIFICIFGLLIAATGVFFIIYCSINNEMIVVVLGVIMVLAGLLDFGLGTRYNGYTKRRIANITDDEAAYRYCKIHGYNRNYQK